MNNLPITSSFEGLSDEEIETHIRIKRYNDFVLTGAIVPSYYLEVKPRSGYRRDVFICENGAEVPRVIASVSAEKIFTVFLELINELFAGCEEVDVILESSHESEHNSHCDHRREEIDLLILQSSLQDFEDLLLNDGNAGIAIVYSEDDRSIEVGIDEHKLITIFSYGDDGEENIAKAESILVKNGITTQISMEFICEDEHIHISSEEYFDEFRKMAYTLGVDIDDPD